MANKSRDNQSPSNRLFNDAKELEEKRIKKYEQDKQQFKENHKFIPNTTKPFKQSPFNNSGRPTVESDIAAGSRLHNYQEIYKKKLNLKQEERQFEIDEEFSQYSFSPRFDSQNYNPETTRAIRLHTIKNAEESIYRILSARSKQDK